jgi:hypothetical protein
VLDLKQPVLGIVATTIVIAVALGFVSLFDFPTFSGWVAYFLLCIIPIQIVIAVTWGGKLPSLSPARQPAQGLVSTVAALGIGAIVACVLHSVVAPGTDTPPMLAMCAIVSVPVTFWLAIMWGGWPFTQLIKQPLAAGLTMLVAAYVVNYILFRIFFDYGFMAGAPVYVAALDPHGYFNAWKALVFYLCALSAMFLVIHFDLWPLTTSPRVMQQPMLGMVWTLIVLVLGGILFGVAVEMIGLDPVIFMVRVPVPFIFGTIIVLNMLQGSLLATIAQPARGALSALAAMVIGSVLSRIYAALAPVVTGQLASGPPSYDFQIWLASALLSVTFPFLIFYAECFRFWPLKKTD